MSSGFSFAPWRRAACHGTLKVMVPMVTTPEEMDSGPRALMEGRGGGNLKAEGQGGGSCRLFGMMVETPAAALTADCFRMPISSHSEPTTWCSTSWRPAATALGLGYLQDPQNPAVLELIQRVCQVGRDQAQGRQCLRRDGRAAGTLSATLLKAGVRKRSPSRPPRSRRSRRHFAN